ncbi:MAG TPA: tetratricopeptide repeat protein [Chitinophagaceae bacterium]|nr:tetratricopeptide repeat protein [Chitinophagaceae bacterium]
MAAPPELLQQVKALNSEEKFRQTLDLLPEDILEKYQDADLYAEAAQASYRLDKNDACKDYAEKALQLNSGQAKAYNYRGNIYLGEKRYIEAIEAYHKAIEIDPTFAYPHNGLGNVYLNLKQYDKAIDAYNKAIETDPKFAYPYNGLGNAYAVLNQYDKAIETYNKAIEIDPKSANPYNGLGNVYSTLNQYDKAIEVYNKAIKIDPTFTYLHNGLGNVYQDLKQYDKAIEVYSKAIEIDPKSANPYNGLGNVYNLLKQYDKAIDAYNKGIEIDPKFAYPYNGLGSASYELNQYNKAIEAYNQAIEIDKTFSAPYYNRAIVYYNNRDYAKALDDYKTYIELEKGKKDYYYTNAKEKIEEISALLADTGFKAINGIINDIKKLLLFNDACITHYTSMTAARILILEKDKLFRLSEGAYLNDPSEGRELLEYLDYKITANDGNLKVAEPFARKPFIGSFVAEVKHDDLTLWRMYGKEAKEEATGCAITLSKDDLIALVKARLIGDKSSSTNTTDNEFSFYRVAYIDDVTKKCRLPDTDLQKQIDNEKTLNGYLEDLKREITVYKEKADKKSDGERDSDMTRLTELLNTIAYLFKNVAYQYEYEVRLVLKGTGFDKQVDVLATPPKTYIELCNIKPAIKKITLGPKVQRSEEWASALYYTLEKESISTEILISHLRFK